MTQQARPHFGFNRKDFKEGGPREDAVGGWEDWSEGAGGLQGRLPAPAGAMPSVDMGGQLGAVAAGLTGSHAGLAAISRTSIQVGETSLLANTPVRIMEIDTSGPRFYATGTGISYNGSVSGNMAPHSIAVQADGKIVLAGSMNGSEKEFALQRYGANGPVDTAFGTQFNNPSRGYTGGAYLGTAIADVAGANDRAQNVVIQPDGKIVVSGFFGSGSAESPTGIAVLRYNANGSLDTSFGGTGKVTTLSSAWPYTMQTVAQADGKIVVVSAVSGAVDLIRYNSDGSLDQTFTGDGMARTSVPKGFSPTGSWFVAATALPDGKILVAGHGGLIRYNTDGSLDSSFGNQGIAAIPNWVAGASVTALSNGKYLLGGHTSTGFALTRFNNDGSLDTGFDGDGVVTTAYSAGRTGCASLDMAVQADGKVLLLGYEWSDNYNMVLLRYNTDGSLDTSFDGDGKLVTTWIDGRSISVLADGKILIGGGNDGGALRVLRLNSDGSLDQQFNSIGLLDATATYTMNGSPVVLDSDVSMSKAWLTNATLQLSGEGGYDHFSAVAGGTVGALVAGGNLLVNGVVVGVVLANSGGQLTLKFSGQSFDFDSLLRQIAYSNTSPSPSSQVQINWKFNADPVQYAGWGTNYETTGTTTVKIVNPNILPPVVSSSGVTSFVEASNASPVPVLLDGSLALSDGDSNTLSSATVSITGGFQAGQDVLAFSNAAGMGNIAGSFAGNTLTLTSAGATATVAQWQAALRAVTYANTSDTPNTGNRTVSITAFDGVNTSAAATRTVTVTAANDTPTGQVSISGPAVQGAVLEVSNTLADPDGMGAVSYQWLRNGAAIAGANGSSYTTGQADVGAQIGVVASYVDAFGAMESKAATPTAAVANVNDVPTGSPLVSGLAEQNQTLSADASGIVDQDGLGAMSYQWLRDGVAIVGATTANYTLAQADVGTKVSVTASYTDGFGALESVTSAETATVANVNDVPTGSVLMSGLAQQNEVLTLDASGISDADGLGAKSYQWLRNGAAIDGANGESYTLVQADVGANVSVATSYTDGFGAKETVTSAATAAVTNVNDLPDGDIAILGSATQGETLTLSNTLTDLDGLDAFTYQWQSDGDNIAGATAASYLLTQAEVGAAITVLVRYTDGFGSKESVTSAPTESVLNVNDLPAGDVAISGNPARDTVLTASNTLTDLDGMGTVSYQWLRAGIAIAGATTASYTLVQADVGSAISVRANYVDGQGTPESVTSQPTATVYSPEDPQTLPGTTGNDSLAGGLGNDFLDGMAGNDTLSGGLGSDSISGGDGNDVLDGGAGNDSLDGGLGNDTMSGGEGSDTYYVDASTDSISEAGTGAGDIDTVITTVTLTLGANLENLVLSGTASINGTGNSLNNLITANAAVNTIDGMGGTADTLSYATATTAGTTGVTLTLNGSTAATASGISGADVVKNVENLIGSDYADTFGGSSGANSIDGGAGNDTINGNAGNDTLNGGAGADALAGGTGNDLYIVDSILDTVTEAASSGTDTVKSSVSWTLGANVENLTLTGTASISATGNTMNNIIIGNAGANTIDGGTGNDTLSYALETTTGTVGVTLRLAAAGGQAVASGISGADVVMGIEYLIGSNYDDTLTGNEGNNSITGGAGHDTLGGELGNDTLSGGLGSDTLSGGAGNDSLDGGVDDDVLNGGDGNDTLIGGLGNDTMDGGSGVNTLSYAAATTTGGTVGVTLDLGVVNASSQSTATGIAGIDLVTNFNYLIGSKYDDSFSGNGLANSISGGTGNDTINGGGGIDTLRGGAGNDVLNGGDGNDSLYGDAGNDTMDGGNGTDTLSFSTTSVPVVLNLGNVDGAGYATVSSTAGTDLVINFENVAGSTGSDFLFGNSGANSISGGAGNDTIGGGLGVDTLTGSTGNDVFVFDTAPNTAANRDTITDFAVGVDKIQLSQAVFSAIGALGNFVAGDVRFLSAAGATAALTAEQRIVYNPTSGILYYDADGVGGVAPEAVALVGVSTHAALTALDLTVGA